MKKLFLILTLLLIGFACETKKQDDKPEKPQSTFLWENANIYFLLTDRFNNGNPDNDVNFGRTLPTSPLRGFEGGDLAGITAKINEGYFNSLGITAIWFTPIIEQIHGMVDEGTGATYGYHGYWAKDWTALDPNFGTEDDLSELVESAHKNGIRIVLDVVINHTGPVTDQDPVWPDEWVRTGPPCTYEGMASTIGCTLVRNLPDIRTESMDNVELPAFLVDKWEKEGRLEKELHELDEFFSRTGYPRAPKYYIIKWLTDYIRKYGVDGFRVDTAKHTEADVWSDLYQEASLAFQDWKNLNSEKVLDNQAFYMVGEVYGYAISAGRNYNYGDYQVDFFDHGFKSLINFEFKFNVNDDYERLFSRYDALLRNPLGGKSVVNYLSSHDDGDPFDKSRERAMEAGTKLLLCPGAVQIYYGDETSRALVSEGARGDANLRTFMNWDELANNASRGGHLVQDVLAHWQKLGVFRANHPAVGAGSHTMLSKSPYLFSRALVHDNVSDHVLVGIDWPSGNKVIPVHGLFPEGEHVKDYYSGQTVRVNNGEIQLDSPDRLILLGR